MDKYTTKELVEELRKREGVDIIILDPYQSASLEVEGPMIILKVID